jgi:hypothetical protein
MGSRRVHTKTIVDIASGRVELDEWYLHNGLWLRAGAMAAFDQDSYAFYEDGTESGSSQVGSTNTQTTLEIDTNYQCRLLIQESGGASGSINTPEFEFNHAGGGWTNVTGSSSPVQAVDSANLTGGGDTTQRLGGGTFVTPNGWVSEDGTMPSLSFGAGEECEGLLSFQILGAAVSHGDEILLRMFNADSYTREADIDVNKSTTRRVMVVD